MSDPREVPPTPGAGTRVWDEYERPHREDAGIYARHRSGGTVPRTEGEIEALIRAHAADLAAAPSNRPHTPAFLHELVATFWHRLFRENPVRHVRLSASMEEQRVAQVAQAVAEERERRFTRRVRELASERKRMGKPATGVTLTRPEALLFCVVPGVVIEVFGSAPSLDAAFDLGKYLSWVFAAAISGILILAAEQLGNTLASSATDSRRQAKWTAVALLTIAIGAGVFTVISLADSRATNLAYQQGGQLNISASNSNGTFGSGVEAGKPKSEGAFGTKQPAASEPPSSPDYEFFIPLSVLVMATAMLFAYRIEIAQDWNELAVAIEESESDVEEAHERREAALEAQRRAMTPEEEVIAEAAVVVEREHGLLTLWMARFVAEYHRFCASLKNDPQRIDSPRIPDPVDALQRMIEPRRQNGPWERSANGSNGGEAGNPPPGGSAEDGPRGNGDGPSGNGAGPDESEPVEETPVRPTAPDRGRGRRSDRGGRPRRFGGGS